MGSVDRLIRVNELLKREIASALERHPMPGSGAMLISVTMAKCSVDLRNATVYVSVFGGGKHAPAEVLRYLGSMRLEFQRTIGKNLKFKHTPVLEFRLDERTALGDRVLELLSDEPESADEPEA